MDPPETPISAATYAEEGLPFYKIYNEVASDVKGDFEGVNAVKAIDKAKDKASRKRGREEHEEPPYKNPIIILNLDGASIKFRPVAELEKKILSKNADEFFAACKRRASYCTWVGS